MSDFFIGCTHFSHSKIIEYCDRPFSSLEEMDSVILNRIRERVTSKDKLFILGDFGFGNFENVQRYVRRLPTKNVFLIRGNHDRLTDQKYLRAGFSWVKDYYETTIGLDNDVKKKVVLFHYPIHSWHGSYRGSWHLHSHTHNSMSDDPTKLRMNVGVDVNDFYPVSEKDIIEFMKGKENE